MDVSWNDGMQCRVDLPRNLPSPGKGLLLPCHPLKQGDTRMVMTEGARGAVLQRSQSGDTLVVSDLNAALEAVKGNPRDGVVWQTGKEPPSYHLLKMTGGRRQDDEQWLALSGQDERQQAEQKQADLIRAQEASRQGDN